MTPHFQKLPQSKLLYNYTEIKRNRNYNRNRNHLVRYNYNKELKS